MDGFVTLYNPATDDPWECPEDAVEYWTGEKKWRKTPKPGNSPAKTDEKG